MTAGTQSTSAGRAACGSFSVPLELTWKKGHAGADHRRRLVQDGRRGEPGPIRLLDLSYERGPVARSEQEDVRAGTARYTSSHTPAETSRQQ